MDCPCKPLVSVLIVCYNQEKYIKEALVSALEQDYENLEVVVMDDASTDTTQKVIREVAQNYPAGRLKSVLSTINLGITGNCNEGLRHCKGELIAFMGGDDVFVQGKIARQVEWFLDNSDRVLCGHDVEWIDEDGKDMGVRSSELAAFSEGKGAGGLIREGSPFAATSIMIKRNRIPTYGFHFALPLVSDWKLWIDVVGLNGEYGYVEGILAKYRRHSESVTARSSWKINRDILMTALLSCWHLRGRFCLDWLRYFLLLLRKRIY